MSVNSILTNSSALSALQSLNMTEQNLSITQNQVSTGLAISNASQNAAYWSIGQQLNSDSGIVTAANSALSQSQAVFDTATSAINSVITTINSIQTAITEANQPNADIANINISLASLSAQLTDAINGASFNGLNILNGSISSGTPMNFVSGFDASSSGGTVSTIGFTTQALTGGPGASVSQTTQAPTVTDAATIASLAALTTSSATTASYGTDAISTGADTLTITSMALDGTTTATTYTGIDTNGNTTTIAAAAAAVAAAQAPGAPSTNAGFAVSVTTTQPSTATSGILSQGGFDLTSLGTGGGAVSAANASSMLTAVNAALQAVTSYSAIIGSTQDRMTAAATLNSALTTNYANGASGLVDADMNQASTRLQALQTQQQLGIQSLAIANQNSQLILKLFNG
jgi:flagellin